MKRVFLLAILAVSGFAAHRHYTKSYAPITLYKQFAEEILKRHYDVAAAMTDGLTQSDLEKAGTQEKIGAGPAMFQTLFPSRFDMESQSAEPDGSVTLNAMQTVLFNPPGVESAMRAAMYAKMHQKVTMHQSGGAWKITSFENKFDSMDAVPKR